MKDWLKGFLGLSVVEERIAFLEKEVMLLKRSHENSVKIDLKPVELLIAELLFSSAMTAKEVSLKLNKSRSYASQLLNEMKDRDILISSKKGRTVYFKLSEKVARQISPAGEDNL